jgi:hypothetical protein
MFRVLQVIKCPIVIANEAKRNEAIARTWRLRDCYPAGCKQRRSSNLRFASYAMTNFGSFICWNTLMSIFHLKSLAL